MGTDAASCAPGPWAQGKYLEPGGGPPGARLNRYKGRYAEAESRYGARPPVVEAVRKYCELAAQEGIAPAELAIRWARNASQSWWPVSH